jgi:hypothetical protein
MRNYFSIQRLRQIDSQFPKVPVDFYEVDFFGAEDVRSDYNDYYNIPDTNDDGTTRLTTEYEELYFEIDRFVVTRLLNMMTFPQLGRDPVLDYLQKTSPRYVWSHNK